MAEKNARRTLRALVLLLAWGTLLTACAGGGPPETDGPPNGHYYGGHPYSEYTELYYVGKPLGPAETAGGTVLYHEIGTEELPAYQTFSRFDGEYHVEGAAWERLWQAGSEAGGSWQLLHWTAEENDLSPSACQSPFLLLAGRADVGTLETDGGSIVGLSAGTEDGGITLVHSTDLDLLGLSCTPFLEVLRESYEDPSARSVLGEFSPVVFYFYHERHGLPPKSEREVDCCFHYYAYWEADEQEYLLQFSSNWTDAEEANGQKAMRGSFQNWLLGFSGAA